MRRVGKTTILKQLFEKIESPNKFFYDFENPMHRRKFEEQDYDNIWENLSENGISKNQRAYIFIDEIQNLPNISSAAKYLIDHYQTKFFLTGSSSYYLKNLFPESMSGRKFIFEVFPLTFKEFLIFKEDEINTKLDKKGLFFYHKYYQYYEEYMTWGGFPGVILEKKLEDKQHKFEEIFNSYFEKDVKTLADFSNVSLLRDLIILLTSQIGSKTDISKLSSTLQVSRDTIYSYLSFLESTYFISFIPQFSKSHFRQAAGRKKVYLCDSGLANYLGKLSQGQLFEQSVFQNLRTNHEISYFDKGRATEIDFILDEKSAIEVKVNPSNRDISNLRRRANLIKITDYKIATLNFSKEEHTIPALNLS